MMIVRCLIPRPLAKVRLETHRDRANSVTGYASQQQPGLRMARRTVRMVLLVYVASEDIHLSLDSLLMTMDLG